MERSPGGRAKPPGRPPLHADAVGGAWARAAFHLALQVESLRGQHPEWLLEKTRLPPRHHTLHVFPDISGRPGEEPGGREQVGGGRATWGRNNVRRVPTAYCRSLCRASRAPSAAAALRKLPSPGCVAATLYQSCRPPGD